MKLLTQILIFVGVMYGQYSPPIGPKGTVTSFSSGNLSPVFTTSVSNPTASPALSFAISTASANQWFGNNSGSTGNPTYSAIGTGDVSPNWYAASTGTSSAYVVALSPAAPALSVGLLVHFKPVAANVGAAPTLAVNGLTAKSITKCGATALIANDLTTTSIAEVLYDGTEFQLLNPQALGCGASTGTVTSVTGTAPVVITNPTTAPNVSVSSATATTSGLVPTPPNTTTTFLRGDATFAAIPAATSTVSGLVPTPPNNTTTFLRGDATWAAPPGGSSGALTQISQVVTSGNQTSVTFSSISGSYSSLIIKAYGKSNYGSSENSDQLLAQFNSDTGSNYYNSSLVIANSAASYGGGGQSTSTGSYVGTFITSAGVAPPSQYASISNIEIIGYSSTSFAKSTYAASSSQQGSGFSHWNQLENDASNWNNTAAITSIKLYLTSGSSFANGSVFTLYGVQ